MSVKKDPSFREDFETFLTDLSAQFHLFGESIIAQRPVMLKHPNLTYQAFTLYVTENVPPTVLLSLDNQRHRVMVKSPNQGVYVGKQNQLVNGAGLPSGWLVSSQGYDEFQTKEELFVYSAPTAPTGNLVPVFVYVERFQD